MGAAQFEARDGDKAYKLRVIDKLTEKATQDGAEALSFHERCITGYSFMQDATLQELLTIAVCACACA